MVSPDLHPASRKKNKKLKLQWSLNKVLIPLLLIQMLIFACDISETGGLRNLNLLETRLSSHNTESRGNRNSLHVFESRIGM